MSAMENNQVTILNVLETKPLDLGIWVAQNILNIRIPAPGPNYNLDIQHDVVPLLPDLANRQALVTELYVVVVGGTPTQTSVRTSDKAGGVKELSEEMTRRKDILYRTIQTLEAMRETASRMITAAAQQARV